MREFTFMILLFCLFGYNILESHGYLDSIIRLPTITTIDVLDFGALGDGITDDTQAFHDSWKQACSSSQDVIIEVPSGRSYLVRPLSFSGPCESQITVQIGGDIIASVNISDYAKVSSWLHFDGLDHLVVQGGGTIDGRGSIWWSKSCRYNKSQPCTNAPTALLFSNCSNLNVNNLKIQNSQQIHVDFESCSAVAAAYLAVTAPETSPNTDGIHVSGSQNVHIYNCTIATGDDCISIVSGSQQIQATNITCGPGHGISIGSLGSENSAAYVSDVIVNNVSLNGTTNGVRIKTWEGGSGTANNIRFENIFMNDVQNPIIIDQNYCDKDSNLPCTDNDASASAVQIRNVTYVNITGISASPDAINFNCSKKYPCQEIVLQNVNLFSGEIAGQSVEASCINVMPQYIGTVSPLCRKVTALKKLIFTGRKLLGW